METKKILYCLSMILCLSAFHPSNTYADVWADYHGTTSTAGIDTGTRYNPHSNLAPPLVLLWSQTDWEGTGNNAVQESSPAIAGGIVYAGSATCGVSAVSHVLYAWDAGTGAPVAGFPAGISSSAMSSPAIANGAVYIGSADHKLYAWNAATGAPQPGFPVTLIDVTDSSPAVANGYVYVGDGSNKIYAIDVLNGNIVWQYQLPLNSMCKFGGSVYHEGFDRCSPAIAEGKLFVTSDDGNGIFVFCMPSPTVTQTVTISATYTPGPSHTQNRHGYSNACHAADFVANTHFYRHTHTDTCAGGVLF